jgi:hypothetical protein
VDFTTLHHLEMGIKDVDGGKILLHFYTNSRGSKLAPAQVQKGYTVAILYAKRHVFKFGEPGIRYEDPQMIKVILLQQLPIYIIELDSCSLTERDITQIFPLSLYKLLALND